MHGMYESFEQLTETCIISMWTRNIGWHLANSCLDHSMKATDYLFVSWSTSQAALNMIRRWDKVQSAAAALREMAEKATADGVEALEILGNPEFERWNDGTGHSVWHVWQFTLKWFSEPFRRGSKRFPGPQGLGETFRKFEIADSCCLSCSICFLCQILQDPEAQAERAAIEDWSFASKSANQTSYQTSLYLHHPESIWRKIASFFPKLRTLSLGRFQKLTAATQATWKSCINIAWSTLLTLDCA